ncbi:MAG: redoxin domain-containing protein [Terriglobia bacterium]|jgi:thiol-disulfide isomerase/thioredoxin
MDLNEPEGAAGGGKTGQPEAGGKVSRLASRGKVLIGAVLAVTLVSGLYLVNRYWIAPALETQAMSGGDHPDAPPISLTDIGGKKLDLADYKGKVVVLDFWATWCGPCRIEIPGLMEMQDKYAKQGFSVIGISLDDEPGPVVEFYKEFKMNYPVAVGNQRIGELYGGIFGLPTTFLIGRDGRIYAKHTGATSPSVLEDEVQQLLAMSPTAENMGFRPGMTAGTSTKIALGDPAAIDSEIPGLNMTKLTATQKEALKKQLGELKCPCRCDLTVLKCRQVDRACRFSLKIAQAQMEKLLKSGV